MIDQRCIQRAAFVQCIFATLGLVEKSGEMVSLLNGAVGRREAVLDLPLSVYSDLVVGVLAIVQFSNLRFYRMCPEI